jgi:hypothetical protein
VGDRGEQLVSFWANIQRARIALERAERLAADLGSPAARGELAEAAQTVDAAARMFADGE